MTQPNRPRPQTPDKKPITPWYWLPFKGLEILLWVWLTLVVLEWSSALWGWQVGIHAQDILYAQINLFEQDYPSANQTLMSILLQLLDEVDGMMSIQFTGFFAAVMPYWQGLVFSTLALLTRILMLLGFYPVFLLAMFVGGFDGLMVRQRRIAHFGRETVTMNYHAKLLLGPLGFYATLIWLIIPGIWPVHPAWILLPFAIVMGLTVRLFVASYKKFL
ncbi:MAG: DUF4400 domain-containing protein [Alphaproteobacteria bacterium]|nr:DUF4400 domain-containing protein [Alphaproteobacteria bacterium]